MEFNTNCLANEALFHITRITNQFTSEESFKIYKGGSTAGALKFTQPAIQNHGTYRWYICLTKSLHTVHLTDTNNNGWYRSSSLILSVGTTTIGTYTLSSGSSATYQFTSIPPMNLEYPRNEIVIQKQTSFSMTPTWEGDYVVFTVSSGLLPSGLSLNPSTGVISGTPSSTCTRNITISCTNPFGVTHYSILFTIIDRPSSCSSGYRLVTITRTTTTKAIEEEFSIYEGNSPSTTYNSPNPSSTLRFTQPTIFDNLSYNWKVCLSNFTFLIHLKDSAGDGWSSSSTVVLSVDSSSIGTYRLSSGLST